MSRNVTLAGWALLLTGALSLSGCADRKGDLGAEFQDDYPAGEPVMVAENGEALEAPPVGMAPEASGDDLEPADPPEPAEAVAEGADDDDAEPVAEAVALPAPTEAPKTEAPGEAVAASVEEAVGQTGDAGLVAQAQPGNEDIETGDGEEAPVAETEPAPAPTPPAEETAEQRAARLLEEAQSITPLHAQEKLARAEAAFQSGLRLYNDLRYEEAMRHFEDAVKLDPTHRNAMEYRGKTRALLGVHIDRIAAKVRELEQVQRVKIQESLVALANAMEEARDYEDKGSIVALEVENESQEEILADQLENLRQAQLRYRRVKEIINWMPPPIDLPNERQAVQTALRRVRQKILDKEDEISFLRREQAMKIAEESRLRETQLFKARVNKLIEQVEDLYNRGEYSAAERLSNRVLQMDPFNGSAEGWKRKARAASHSLANSDNRENYRHQLKLTWEQVDSDHIPYGELLTYPPNWDEISRRPERSAIGKTKVEEQWKKDIKKSLARKVSFEFVDTPLNEAITFLRSLTDVTMIVDPKVLEAGAPPINLRVTDMSLELALEWILKLADLDYALKDHAIFISKKSTLVEDIELRIYDVSDLTQQIPDFPGPDFQLTTVGDDSNAGGGGAAANPFQMPAQTQQLTPASIADMIRNRVMPDSWDASQGTSIEERAGKLVVMQRPEVHELVNRLLSNFRATQRLMVNIESRFLQIREAYLEDIGVEFQGLDPNVLFGDFGDIRRTLPGSIQPRLPGAGDSNPNPVNVPFPGFTNGPDRIGNGGDFSQVGAITNHTINFGTVDPSTISSRDPGNLIRQGGLSAQLTILNNAQVQAFVRALGARENTSQLIAPRLTVFNTQRAHMFVARQQSYVADYEISGDSYDPVIRQFLVGVVLDVRPTVSADRRYVTMELRPTVTELLNFQTRQIDSFTVQQGGNVIIPILLSFPVQFPELSIRRVRTTATVPDGGILLIGGLARNVKFNAENGVPFLSDLPVIGRIFRWNTVDNAKQNLAILVSPRIILFTEEEAKL